jgi:hypothetical protein
MATIAEILAKAQALDAFVEGAPCSCTVAWVAVTATHDTPCPIVVAAVERDRFRAKHFPALAAELTRLGAKAAQPRCKHGRVVGHGYSCAECR